MRRDRASGSGAFTASATVKNAHGDKCEALNRDFTAAEVAEARKRIRDTGPGADGLEPVVLTGHDLLRACKCVDCGAAQAEMSGVSDEFSSEANPDPAPNADGGASSQCRSAQELAALFNDIKRRGKLPDAWRLHRFLLHYKGKQADPHCVESYRFLGIDQAHLKLLSLVMEERLMTFLKATNALSRTQGGFLRKLGTPEQAFTLAETVRAAMKRKRVTYLEFVDISGPTTQCYILCCGSGALTLALMGRFCQSFKKCITMRRRNSMWAAVDSSLCCWSVG
jgi:hypothetical protein